MIYTIGHSINYRDAFKKYGQLVKVGKRPVGSLDFPQGYKGGYAFSTYCDGLQRILEAGYEGMEVFGLDAEWTDTEPSGDGWWHHLLVDANIILFEQVTGNT